MNMPKEFDKNKQETALARLHAIFTDVALAAAVDWFPGQYETIGYRLEEARAVLLWLGCLVPIAANEATDVSKDGIVRQVADVCALITKARTQDEKKRFHVAIAASIVTVTIVCEGRTVSAFAARRDEARHEGRISDDALYLLGRLVEIEDSFAGMTITPISATERYALHGRIQTALEKFHRLTQENIAQLAAAYRNDKELRLAA